MTPFDTPRKKKRLGAVAVAGASMEPTYTADDWLLVLWGGSYRNGQAVLVERVEQPGVFLIKRVLREVEGRFWVEGDNKGESTDSRQWGAVSHDEIVATVLFRYRKAGTRKLRHRKN